MPRSLKAMASAPDPLSPLIDRYFLERKYPPSDEAIFKPNLRRGGRFTPSSCGDGKCLRASVFQYMQVNKREKRDPEQQLIFAVGDATHHMWYRIFIHMEEVLGPEVFRVVAIEGLVAYPPLFLGGWFDLHVEIYGKPYLIDLKTIKDSGFTERMHTKSPDKAHIGQLVRYLRCRSVPRGLVVYLNKNDQRWKVFQVRYQDHKEVWLRTRRWIKRGIAYLRERRVPPMHPDCVKGSRMAKDCPWSYLCFKKSPAYIQAITFRGKPNYDDLWEETTGKVLQEQESTGT